MKHRQGRMQALHSPQNLHCHRTPAVSAHSLLPIWTNLEQQRANAKSSSSPVNIELAPTVSLDKPCDRNARYSVSELYRGVSLTTHQIIHDTPHMCGHFVGSRVWVVRKYLEYRYFRSSDQLDFAIVASIDECDESSSL